MRQLRNDYLKTLSNIRQTLWSPTSTMPEMSAALGTLHSMLSDISGIKGALKNRIEGFETDLGNGMALSPGFAADCLLDTLRTVKYIHALDDGIRAMRQRFPGRCIDIVYAGTGPFAPFALAVMGRYSPSQIRFTALDIHLQSLATLKGIAVELNLDAYFRSFVHCDASEYQLPHDDAPHIVVTETMHRAVAREPQVAITLNLAPQLRDGGILIPQRITVDAALSETAAELAYVNGDLAATDIRSIRLPLGTVFALTKDATFDFSADGGALVCGTALLPEGTRRKSELVLSTNLQLFEDIYLREGESDITQPVFVRDLEELEPGDRVQFMFTLRGCPRLTCFKITSSEDPFNPLERIAETG